MSLAIYDPGAWLRQLVFLRRKQALVARTEVNAKIRECSEVAEKFIEEHCPKQKRKITELRAALRARTLGVPLTEVLDDPLLGTKITPLSDADQVLLKKAYKLAASMIHPDKGGSVEEFQALHAAYIAQDLRSVQEFVLHLGRGLYEQLLYWKTECERPSITWLEFQQNPAYQITREIRLGTDIRKLQGAVELMLRHMGLQLEAQLINLTAHQSQDSSI